MPINGNSINSFPINGNAPLGGFTYELDAIESFIATAQKYNAFSGNYGGLYSEAVDLAPTLTPYYSTVISELATVSPTLTSEAVFAFSVAATLRIKGDSQLAYIHDFAESVIENDSINLTNEIALAFTERLVSAGSVETTLHGMLALSEAISLAAILHPGIGAQFADFIVSNEASTLGMRAEFLESLAATEQTNILFRASIPISEFLALTALHNTGLDAAFAEALGVSGAAYSGLVAAFSEVLRTETASDGIHHADVSLTESLKEVASSVLGLHADFDDSAALSDSSVIAIASLFLETLSKEDQLNTLLHANLPVAEALALTALHRVGSDANLTETMIVGDGITLDSNMVLSLLETLVLGETPEWSAKILCPISEALTETTGLTTQASLHAALIEGIEIGGVLNTPEGVFEAWVVNAETKAPWQYDNYPFNSFAFAGNKYLALTDSGLYELTGSDDDGTNIDTVIRTGLENFGSNQKKSIPWAYFGYTSSGRILFKTITTATGKKVENWYELEARTADDDTETRVNIGRGLRSVYWQFELTNIDGAEFEFDDIQLMPARLKRRL